MAPVSTKRSLAWLWLLVAIQIAIPASYYLRGRERDDERFAWRMFSGVRLKRCSVSVTRALADGSSQPVALERTLHSSWINALKRGRTSVIERYLAKQCSGSAAVELARSCEGVKGAPSSSEIYRYDCGASRLSVGSP